MLPRIVQADLVSGGALNGERFFFWFTVCAGNEFVRSVEPVFGKLPPGGGVKGLYRLDGIGRSPWLAEGGSADGAAAWWLR
jgi:hypothetical protein